MRMSSVVKWIMGISFIVSAVLISIVVIRGGAVAPWIEHWTIVASVMFLASLIALPCARTFECGRLPDLMLSGLAAAGFSLIVVLVLLWFEAALSADALRLSSAAAATAGAWAVFCAVIGVVLQRRLASWPARIAAAVPIIIAGAFAVMVMLTIWAFEAVWGHDEWLALKWLIALAVLTLAGALISTIVNRWGQLTSTGDDEQHSLLRIETRVWCPRCEHEQTIMTGGAKCDRCGLSIRVVLP